MNILFVNTFDVSPFLGGTERIADTLCREFRKRCLCRCYLAYYEGIDSLYKKTVFDGRLCLGSRKNVALLIDYIVKKDIDVVLLQGQLGLAKGIRQAIGKKIKIIFAHHLYPGVEREDVSWSNSVLKCWKSRGLMANMLRLTAYPILKVKHLYALPLKYKDTYDYSDKVVLLSSELIQPFTAFGHIKDTDKFSVIPNTLSFDIFFPFEKIYEKEKVVLIVSRLVENPKRISLALRSWKELMSDDRLADWKLVIVGSGSDENNYKSYVAENDIKNIYFEGNKNPLPYYQKASVFLMTSALESWGLTITEAQQFGVVPVAFDSYPSLHEVIENNVNGITVKNDRMDLYVEAVRNMMLDSETRNRLAESAIKKVQRFSAEQVVKQWLSIF